MWLFCKAIAKFLVFFSRKSLLLAYFLYSCINNYSKRILFWFVLFLFFVCWVVFWGVFFLGFFFRGGGLLVFPFVLFYFIYYQTQHRHNRRQSHWLSMMSLLRKGLTETFRFNWWTSVAMYEESLVVDRFSCELLTSYFILLICCYFLVNKLTWS